MSISRADAADRNVRSLEPPTDRGQARAAPAPASGRRAAADARLDKLPAPAAYAAFLADIRHRSATALVSLTPVASEEARDAMVRVKLDSLRDAFSGPYFVDGSPVIARPMFRMTTHAVGTAIENEVDSLARAAGLRGAAAT